MNDLYDFASVQMNREYDEKVRFAFALHINSTIERIRGNQFISHPNLNGIRRNYSKNFNWRSKFPIVLRKPTVS